MHSYLNCLQPKDHNGSVICSKCGTEHKIEYDGSKAPYKESGTESYKGCGIEMLKWKSTRETYLVKVDNGK